MTTDGSALRHEELVGTEAPASVPTGSAIKTLGLVAMNDGVGSTWAEIVGPSNVMMKRVGLENADVQVAPFTGEEPGDVWTVVPTFNRHGPSDRD